MIYVLVELKVLSFIALEPFEEKAIEIMRQYSGQVVAAFETERNGDRGKEIHILSFLSKKQFEQYKIDSNLLSLNEARSKAIEATTISISEIIKHY